MTHTAELFSKLYEDLCRKAEELTRYRDRHRREAGALPPAALVHEAFVKMASAGATTDWKSHRHFYHGASRAMRQILIDQARHHSAAKRGGGLTRIGLDELDPVDGRPDGGGQGPRPAACSDTIEAALDKLRKLDWRQYRVVVDRYFAGLGEAEIAQRLGVTVKTVQRDWKTARQFLADAMAMWQDEI
jgi:RNA polymerase sigma factor (TIGR02999 family)